MTEGPSAPYYRPDQLLGARHDHPDTTGELIGWEAEPGRSLSSVPVEEDGEFGERCPDCHMPLTMHHDPMCSMPCGRCEEAKHRAEVERAAADAAIRKDERKRVADEGVPFDRERLGRMVREIWVATAREHPDPKPSWLVPWDELGEWDKEVDRRIGEAVASHAALVTAIETHQVGSRERAALIRQRDLAMTEAAKLCEKLAAITAYINEKCAEFNAAMPMTVRPQDMRIDAGDILAIITGEADLRA